MHRNFNKRYRKGAAACSFAMRSVNEVYAGSVPALREREPAAHSPVRVLIAGTGSYIGTCVQQYLSEYGDYIIHMLDMRGITPKPQMFCSYDTVLFVAGIAHRKQTRRNAHLYYEVNRDLAVKTAKAAKAAKVPHFVILSSMAVYGMDTGHITKDTIPEPKDNYGKSKLQADEAVWRLRDGGFRTAILRPPMVYGKGCRGNYQLLRKLVLAVPVFPVSENERSVVYIGNLCAFIKEVIDEMLEGIFFPQNGQYVDTGVMAGMIAAANGRRLKETRLFRTVISRLDLKIIRKIFGSLTYEKTDAVYNYSFEESINMTEQNDINAELVNKGGTDSVLQINGTRQKRVLVLSTSTNSYIGESISCFMKRWPDLFQADVVCRKDGLWKEADFKGGYCAVLFTGSADTQQEICYGTDRYAAVRAADMAKKMGAVMFLYLSSLRVYGKQTGVITKEMPVCPADEYGKAVLFVENELRKREDAGFQIAVLRLPAVYGYRCRSWYQTARRFAFRHGYFPKCGRKCSILHIDNLSSVVRNIILSKKTGVFFPQDVHWASTYEMVMEAAGFWGIKIKGTKLWNPLLRILAAESWTVWNIFFGYACGQNLNVPVEWLDVKNIKEGIQLAESGWHFQYGDTFK